MRKRLVSLFITAAILTVSLCADSFVVFAEETVSEEIEQIEISREEMLLIEKLEAFGIITNEYAPAEFVTRRQMAEVIAKYIGLTSYNASGKSPFPDVSAKDVSFGAINSLYDLGIITGDDKFNFNPDENVTMNEAIVFIINAVGHKVFATREGGYPTGYLRIAIKYGLLDELKDIQGTNDVTFIDVYKMLDAALKAATVEYSYLGDGSIRYTLSETETFLSTTYGIKEYRGIVTGNENTYLTSPVSNMTDEQISIQGNIYDTPGYVYGYFLGYAVDYYLKAESGSPNELMYVEEAPRRNIVTRIDSEDILANKTTSTRLCYEDENQKDQYLPIEQDADIIYNNQNFSGIADFKTVLPVNGYVELLDNDNDGSCEVFFVYDYVSYVVDSVDSINEKIKYEYFETENGVSTKKLAELDLDSWKHKVNIQNVETGEKVEFSAIAKGDVISVAQSKAQEKIITVYISRKTVTGKIEGQDTEAGYLIDGEFYRIQNNYSDYNETALHVGLSGSFYLDMNDEIVLYKYDSTTDANKLALMSGLDYKESGMFSYITVRLYTQDGEFIEANVAEKVRIDNDTYNILNASDRVAVLRKIAQNYNSDGKYAVNSTYLVRYKLNTKGEITAIDMGGIGGTGNLNLMVDRDDSMTIRNNFIVSVGDGRYIHYDNDSGVIFCAPRDGDAANLRAYGIYGKLKTTQVYNNKYFDSYSAYTYMNSDVQQIDVMIFHGSLYNTGLGTAVCTYTHYSDTVDADGATAKKLYSGDDVIGVLADNVTFVKDGVVDSEGRTPVYTADEVIAHLNCGDTLYGTYNADEEIDTIKVLATYDETTGVMTPTIKGGSNVNEDKNGDPINVTGENYKVGKVVSVDVAKGLLEIMVGTKTYMFDVRNTKTMVYEGGKTYPSSVSELYEDQQIVIGIEGYFTVSDIAAYR